VFPTGCPNLRLAVVSPFVDRQHGTERVLAELLSRLAGEYQCVIHLYSQKVYGLTLENSRRGTEKDRPGIYWHRVPSVPGPHLLQFLGWLFANTCCRWWNERIHGERCDLVLSPGINCFDADVVIVHALFQRVWQVAQAARTDQVKTLRDLHRRTYYRLLVGLEKKIYSNSKVALGAVSQRAANLLETNFSRKDVCVLPNAVDLAVFSPEQRESRRVTARQEWNFATQDVVVLLIGNDWAVKGLGTLLEAIRECRNPKMRLLVAGGDAPGPFVDLAARLGIGEQVHWVKPRADVMSLYAAADIYASPTREDAFALPPLEAMACGLPVITTVCNGGAEVIYDWVNGIVLDDPADVPALAEVLRRLSLDEELRRRVGEMASLAAKTCTWQRNAAKTWEFLNEVARAKNLGSKPNSSL
jgi:glycosyltransferase involved in cell wall biosynthesis